VKTFLLLLTPIIIVTLLAIYFIWTIKKREKRIKAQQEILESGDRGEHKVQTILKSLEKPRSRYKVYHNIELGPDLEHTNEYDTVVVGPNGIFHIETKNYGGERGGVIIIDKNNNWTLYKNSGYSKKLPNPSKQVNSHEYRLQGFLKKYVGIKNVPTQGIVVLSCDNLQIKNNRKKPLKLPVVYRNELVDYIKNYKSSKLVLYPRTIKKICKKIEAMNNLANNRPKYREIF